MTIPLKTMEMAGKYLEDAKLFVAGRQYMKVKKLAIGLNIPNSIAGCVFRALGWEPINPNPRKANKTYENPNFEKV